MKNKFVHLHTHTEYSFLDGAIQISQLIKKAKEFEMDHLAITDHGGLFGAIEFYKTCIKNHIKPILGYEAYICDGKIDHKTKENRKNNHIILLAKNNTGWKNLIKLASIGYTEGFYYKPRIDIDILKKYSSGIIATSACIGGAIPRTLVDGGMETAIAIAEQYAGIFGESNFYIELQDHGIKVEKEACKGLVEIANKLGLPLIVANDAHYLNKEDAEAHEVLLCMQTKDTLDNPKHYKFQSEEIYFKSPTDMALLFPEIPEAMTNTYYIAEQCNVDIYRKPQLPVSQIPDVYSNPDHYLKYLIKKGAKEKYGKSTPEILNRIKTEYKIITSMGFSGYFLITRDFLIESDRLGIMRGCRGSAAGSIIAYCIGITNVDPLKYDLIFERFLNPDRISMPDVDIDIADKDRYTIIGHIIDKYGRDAVCQIINFGRMKAKAVVKDIARVMRIPLAEAEKLSKMITEDTLVKSIEINNELKSAIENNPKYQEIIRYARTLEGIARQPGMHAGGLIIAPSAVSDWAPVFKQTKTNAIMTQYDMQCVEDVGLIKMDILGSRTLTVLQEACKNINIDLWNIPIDDEKVYKLFQNGETVNIFQFESQGIRDCLKKLKPTCIEDIIAMSALYRPGPIDNIDSFIRRKNGKEKIDYPHPMLKGILGVTYGIIVYQEQVMRIAQKMGGFTLGQADILRKAMGKKIIKKMKEMKVKFLEGSKGEGISEDIAIEVYKLIAKFAEYGFNKAHATVYAHVSYQAAYLKVHHPIEYMRAVLTSYIGDKDKFLIAKKEAERMGLSVSPPDINCSEIGCSIVDGGIIMGLSVIANVGKCAESIIKHRGTGYKSVFDFCTKVDLRVVNKKAIESLIMGGAMDCIGKDRATLFENITRAMKYSKKFQLEIETGQQNLFGNTGIRDPELTKCEKWSNKEKLSKEKEVLNFYISGHPLDRYKEDIKQHPILPLNSDWEYVSEQTNKVLVFGIVIDAYEYTQSNGDNMCFLTIEDFDGIAELIVFADTYNEYRELCVEDSMVIIRGVLSKRDIDDEYKIIVNKMLPLSKIRKD